MDKQKIFPLHPRNRFNTPSDYHSPQQIGYYSLDINRQICHDQSQLRYLVESKAKNSNNVSYDLMQGFEKMIYNDFDSNEKLDHILKWVLKHRDVFADQTSSETPTTKNTTDKLLTLKKDFVVKRGCLTQLLCTPYESKEYWDLTVIRFKDTFYLCEIQPEWKESDYDKKNAHIGWKFEQYLTTDKLNGEPDTSVPINNCEAYYRVMETKLNEHSLILSGEIDCMDSNGEYVELKSKVKFQTKKKEENFKRFKLQRYWAQSILLGVPRIICGFHDNNVVNKLQTYDTDKIPDMVKQDQSIQWNPEICFGFLDQFLTFIKETIQENDHRKVYLFSRKQFAESITCQLLEPDTKSHFLPQWYIDEFKN